MSQHGEFLITQFSSLQGHIDGLFNAGTQRVAAYLIFAGFVFAGLQLVPSNSNRLYFIAGGLLVTAVVGVVIWFGTITINIRAVEYFRIMNQIRGYFAGQDVHFREVLKPLPFDRSLPSWNSPVFDPGIRLVEAILALSGSGFVFSSYQFLTAEFRPSLGIGVLFLLIAAVIWVVLELGKRLRLYRGLAEKPEERTPVKKPNSRLKPKSPTN